MSRSRLNNNDNNLNKDDGLKINEDDSATTPKALKDAKIDARAKGEASARLDEESLPLISNVDSRGGPEWLKSIRPLTLTPRVKPR
jgi:hypothetical protein